MVAQNQLHITADISFALRRQFALTYDLDWLNLEGCPLAIEIAEFWESRITYNETTKFYEIRGIKHC